jgi:hypothetical protein
MQVSGTFILALPAFLDLLTRPITCVKETCQRGVAGREKGYEIQSSWWAELWGGGGGRV